MYPIKDFREMQQIDIRGVHPQEAVDISEIEVDMEQPISERVRSYAETVKNPFLVKVGDYIVKLEYGDCKETLNDRMKQYISKMAEVRY